MKDKNKCKKCIWSKDVGTKYVCLFPTCVKGGDFYGMEKKDPPKSKTS